VADSACAADCDGRRKISRLKSLSPDIEFSGLFCIQNSLQFPSWFRR
jgi:hypothetical protein